MKKLSLILILALSMVFVACKKSSTEALSMIPNDAKLVLAVDVKNLIEKANISIKDGQIVFPDSYSSLISKNMTDKDRETLSIVAKSGIDFNEKIYVFGSDDFDFFAIIPVSDKEAIRQVFEEQDNIEFAADGDLYTNIDNNDIYVISDNHFIMARAQNISNEQALDIAKQLEQNGSTTSITENDDAMTMLNRNADIALYADYKEMMNMSGSRAFMRNIYNSSLSQYFDMFRSVGITINCNKKDLETKYEIFYNESELTEQIKNATGKPSADGLKFIPSDMQMVFYASIKGEELLKIDAFNQLLANTGSNPFIASEELKSLIASIDGPITIGYDYVDAYLNKMSIPHACGAIKTSKAKELCEKIQNAANGIMPGICSNNNDEYVINISSDKALIFGHKDGFFTFRTMPQAISKSMYDENSVARDIFNKNVSALYADFSKGTRANTMITSMMPRLQLSGYATMEIPDTQTCNIKLAIDEPEGNNILETLLSIIASAQMN